MTEIDVVDYLLNQNKFFENSYDLYQDILYHLQSRNYDGFNRVINKEYRKISSYMKTALNTLKKYSKYIKKISFGFRNFRNMKSRIMIITNIFRKEKRKYHTKYSISKYA